MAALGILLLCVQERAEERGNREEEKRGDGTVKLRVCLLFVKKDNVHFHIVCSNKRRAPMKSWQRGRRRKERGVESLGEC